MELTREYYSDLQGNLQLINQLCSNLCGSTTSLFNIFDDEFQFTISTTGEWEEWKWPREETICGHTVNKGKLVEVNEISKDNRFNKLAMPEGFVAEYYIGISLKYTSGKCFGTLCAMDKGKKSISKQSKIGLLLLGKQLEEILKLYEDYKVKKEIEKYLQEKELMFSEIHHRIKNNLADICGMLQMERAETNEPSLQRILTKSESRLIAAIKLHEQLYESQKGEQINLKIYFKKLIENLNSVAGSTDSTIHIYSVVEEIMLNYEQALPLGLIISELITNAFQHAFTSKPEGTIALEVRKSNKGFVYVRVKDNGDGMTHTEEFYSSFGIRLVKLLARQLKASTKFYNQRGSVFEMKFKEMDRGNQVHHFYKKANVIT